MEHIGDLFKQKPLLKGRTPLSEYEYLVFEASKMVGMPYIVMHKRLEKVFHGSSLDMMQDILRRWVHTALKSPNKGKVMNGQIKRYVDQI